jgi:hypothetical protein
VLVTLGYLSGAASFAHGQGSALSGTPVIVNGVGQPMAGVTVAVCTSYPGANPTSLCTGSLATLYTDITVSVACSGTLTALNNQANPSVGSGCSNPGLSDGQGNVVAFSNAGVDWCEYSGSNIIGIIVVVCPFPGMPAASGPGSPTGSLQGNNAGVFGGVPHSTVNFTSGNVTSTAAWSVGSLNATTTVNATTTSSAAQFLSNASNPATAGAVALAHSDSIFWRNFANTANEGFGVDSSDRATANFAGGFALEGATANLWFGGTGLSFPMLKRVSTGLTLRLGNDGADGGPFEALSFVVAGSQAITGVQGSTGTNFFVCAAGLASGDLVSADANGNCADSGTGPIFTPSSPLRIEFGTGTGSGTITFSPAFSGTPVVLFTTGGIGTTNYSGSITNTSVTVNSSDGAPYTWFAIGPK